MVVSVTGIFVHIGRILDKAFRPTQYLLLARVPLPHKALVVILKEALAQLHLPVVLLVLTKGDLVVVEAHILEVQALEEALHLWKVLTRRLQKILVHFLP